MKRKRIVPLGLLLIALGLAGCHRQTTVYFVPDTHPAATPSTATAPSTTPPVATAPATTQQEATIPPETTLPETTPTTSKPPKSPTVTQKEPPPKTEPKATDPPAPTTEPPVTTEAITEPTAPPPPNVDLAGELLGALNRCRGDAGVPPLTLDSDLSALASCRAAECASAWGHTRPDGRGWETVLTDAGYPSSGGENLLYCQGQWTAQELVEMWMGSPSHRQILLDPAYTRVGLGKYTQADVLYLAGLFLP